MKKVLSLIVVFLGLLNAEIVTPESKAITIIPEKCAILQVNNIPNLEQFDTDLRNEFKKSFLKNLKEVLKEKKTRNSSSINICWQRYISERKTISY